MQQRIRVLQIIVYAMMGGLGVFMVVALALSPIGDTTPEAVNMFLAVLGGLAVMEAMTYLAMRGMILAQLRKWFEREPPGDDAEARVLPAMTTITLIRSAMIEGTALFGTVILLLSGWKVLAVVPVLGIVLLAMGIPTETRLRELATSITGRNPFAQNT